MKSIGKNKLKDIYKLHFNQLLNQISDTEYLYANDQDAKKSFDKFHKCVVPIDDKEFFIIED